MVALRNACRRPSGTARADHVAVDRPQRRYPAHGARQECLTGPAQVGWQKWPLIDRHAQLVGDLDHDRAGDAGKRSTGKGRRVQHLSEHEEQVARASLREMSPGIEQHRLVGPSRSRLGQSQHRIYISERLHSCCHRMLIAPAGGGSSVEHRARVVRHGGSLGDRDDAGRIAMCGWRQLGLADAAAYRQPKPSLENALLGGGADRILDDSRQVGRKRKSHAASSGMQPAKMRARAKYDTVGDAHRLEKTVGKREAAIEGRQVRGTWLRLNAVDPDERIRHQLPYPAGIAAPSTSRRPRALFQDSTYSASGSESTTIPPPAEHY